MSNLYTDILKTETKSIGFEYQYYFFLYELLGLAEGAEIGLEEKDDVHIQIGKKLLLVQLKHTTQTNENGKLLNLTERNIDLWKTLHNWLGIIQNKSFNRETEIQQSDFLENTYFQLVTNKSFSNRNKFLVNLTKLKKGKIQINEFIEYLQTLYDKTNEPEDDDKENKIKEYIKEIKSVNPSILNKFLNNIAVETSFDDIIKKVFKRIKHLKVEEKHIELVFNCIDSNLRLKNYEDIKNKKRIKITADEFTKQFTRCFYIARSPNLPQRNRNYYEFPENPKVQIFIKQLVDIGDINLNDDSEIINLTNQKLRMMSDMTDWIRESELMPTERPQFDEDSINKWKNYFKKVKFDSEEINEDDKITGKEKLHNKLARECLEKVRAIPLQISNNSLNSIQSNGQFYYLSDKKPRIGWLYNWTEKY